MAPEIYVARQVGGARPKVTIEDANCLWLGKFPVKDDRGKSAGKAREKGAWSIYFHISEHKLQRGPFSSHSATLHHALAAGMPVDAPAGGVAADSLAPRQVGQLMFPLMQRYGASSVLVSDAAIIEAQCRLWRVLRVVVEPGGSAASAALQSGAWRADVGQTVGVLLCGANTTAVDFS